MTSPPSARPPSSNRRPPDLDSPEARAFVERAASHPEPVVEIARPREAIQPAVPVSRPAAPEAPRAETPRKEVLRPLTLRIPDSLHSSLLYIAENGSKSMNQFVIEALNPAVEAQMKKIAKRKELGLD
jgi:hypothetical protein